MLEPECAPASVSSNEFDKAEREINRIQYFSGELEHRTKYDQFGICWNCRSFRYHATKYGKEVAVCQRYDRPDTILSSSDPVVECTDHSNKFEMSLSMMFGMARLIDVEKPRQAGFITEEEEK